MVNKTPGIGTYFNDHSVNCISGTVFWMTVKSSEMQFGGVQGSNGGFIF